MKSIKRLTAALLAVMMLLSFAACGGKGGSETTTEETVPPTTDYVREVKTKVAALNGPTGLGLAKIAVDKSYAYDVEYFSDPQEVVPLLTKGEVDIAALPINLAANLYKKTNGGIQILAINTLGVLHVVENGDSIKSVADLKGKTVYSTGQGSTPEYIVNYILSKNGIDPEKDIDIQYKTAHNELATLAIEGKADICILPEPFATKVRANNENYREALDLTAEWDKVCDVKLAQGVVVARTDYIKQNPEIIEEFLSFNEVSVNFLNVKPDSAALFLEANGYFEKAELAKATLPGCNIVFIKGEEMKEMSKAMFGILFEANPASVGGEIPDDNIYYGA
ncbi:MAG: ABC transporter substrate-binding protein [Oscillospiraceae bacterium]|nr:ABC transporter substrate-binding protein [Oscillospiraceae bacterium]